jgi:NADH:ubiquinone oxidoreductase subunit 4 (subunit M)
MDLAHLHLMMNHVPVMGVLFAILIALIGGIARSKIAVRVGLIMLVLSGLIAVPVYLTGESAEELVEGLPGVSEALIDRHESAAGISLALVGVSGAFALLTLLFSGSSRQLLPGAFFVMTMLLALLGGASVINTANLGGQIRHTEIGAANGATPAGDTGATEKKSKEDHDDD